MRAVVMLCTMHRGHVAEKSSAAANQRLHRRSAEIQTRLQSSRKLFAAFHWLITDCFH